MLNQCAVMGFVPTKDTAKARAFYVDLLDLPFVSEDNFALVVSAKGTLIRITAAGEFTPAPHTILGWQVPDIAAEVKNLSDKGIIFERFTFLEQDSADIWTSPDGTRVAWFRDVDGNTLSISQHT